MYDLILIMYKSKKQNKSRDENIVNYIIINNINLLTIE